MYKHGVTKLSITERNELVLKHLNLVKIMALRLSSRLPSHITFDELFSSGVLGLIDAAEKYDASHGLPFEKYALIRIRGAMLDEIRSRDVLPRQLRVKANELEKTISELEKRLGRYPTDEEIANEMDLDIEQYYSMLDELRGLSLLPQSLTDMADKGLHPEKLVTDGSELDDHIHRQELKEILTELISKLPEREKIILSLYYYEELTMKEIGQILGYTESRISQLHTSILLKLRTRLTRRLKKDDMPDT